MTGSDGYFTRRINYIKEKKKKCTETIETNRGPSPEVRADENEDLLFLKNADISKLDWNLAIEKLNSSRRLRKLLLLEKQTDLRENFPYFFSHPKLVSDFLFQIAIVKHQI